MSAYLLDSVDITDAVLHSSTIPLPDSSQGEVTWTSGAAHVIDDLRVDPVDHMVYSCVKDHTGRAVRPGLDAIYWLLKEASNRWRMFDDKVMTDSVATASMTVVLRPGFINAVQAYSPVGAAMQIVYEDAPGGTVLRNETVSLQEPPVDWYDWAFGQIRPLENVLFKDLVPYPNAQITVTVTAGPGNPVGLGKLLVGDLIPLVDESDPAGPGGVGDGPSAEPISHSYVDIDQWGNTRIEDGATSTDLRFTLLLPTANSDYVLQVTRRRLGKPTSWILSDRPGFRGLNTFGLGQLSVKYGTVRSEASGYVKGMI